jgi:DNA-3-methyladenine glycosylase II
MASDPTSDSASDPAGPDHRLTVDLPAPIDLPSSLAPLGRSGDDGLDRWSDGLLVRTARLGPHLRPAPYVARPAGSLARPALAVTGRLPDGASTSDLAAAVYATFVARPGALADLAAADERIARLAALYPGLVPVLVTDPFTALVRSISAQQVNLRWAAVVRRRLAERYGTRHSVAGEMVFSLHPEPLAEATVDELRTLQLTTSKAVSVIACARAGASGELEPARLAAMSDEELSGHLTLLPGIGRWSAEWFLARTLGRPRVVAGDLGVRKAVGRLYGTAGLPSEDEVRRLTAHWGAAAAVAQTLALHDLAIGA